MNTFMAFTDSRPINTDYGNPNYAWDSKNKEIITFIGKETNAPDHVAGMCIVDTNFEVGAGNRYGRWIPNDYHDALVSKYKWEHIPMDSFPAEFKLQLLLLGVT